MNKLQKESINHYNHMRKWVKTQPKNDPSSDYLMMIQIGENWFSDDCSYCNNYSCSSCPLEIENKGCCNGLWSIMNFTSTWKDWLKASKKVMNYIRKHG